MIKHLAVVGATGAVGQEVCALVTERGLDPQRVSLFASGRSAGKTLPVAGREIPVLELTEGSFNGVDFAIFSAGSACSKRFAPAAVRAGAVVIDNSSAFRMDPDVPLVVPEINPEDANAHRGIIANPNCSTIIMAMAVWPLHRANPVRRIVVSTYQAASGAGAAAMEELRTQAADCLAGREPVPRVFPHPIAFNLFSHDTPIGPDGYNLEERKMIDETRKIFHEPPLPAERPSPAAGLPPLATMQPPLPAGRPPPDSGQPPLPAGRPSPATGRPPLATGRPPLAISATCIRVPILRAHSESINLTFDRPITPDEAREILASAPGIEVVDDVETGRFPMPVDATGRDEVLVGRIRQDVSQPDGRGIELFACADQLRKGAALNAIQILELLAG